MNKHTYIGAVILTSAILAGAGHAAEPTHSPTVQLAMHPVCYATRGGTVVVRGAVAIEETGEPIEGARVKLTVGDKSVTSEPTDSQGRYYAVIQNAVGAVDGVAETATYLPKRTGSLLLPVAAQSFAGKCGTAGTGVGALQKVK